MLSLSVQAIVSVWYIVLNSPIKRQRERIPLKEIHTLTNPRGKKCIYTTHSVEIASFLLQHAAFMDRGLLLLHIVRYGKLAEALHSGVRAESQHLQEKLWCTDNPFTQYWGWVTGVGMRTLPVLAIALLNVLLLYGLMVNLPDSTLKWKECWKIASRNIITIMLIPVMIIFIFLFFMLPCIQTFRTTLPPE